MNRSDLQQLARLRLREAEVLLDTGCYEGAYYLTGYAVECALKACIAKKTKEFDFPDKGLATKAHTHDLDELVKLAGLLGERERMRRESREFYLNWGLMKDWSESKRYEVSIDESAARDFYRAVAVEGSGVLSWLMKWW